MTQLSEIKQLLDNPATKCWLHVQLGLGHKSVEIGRFDMIDIVTDLTHEYEPFKSASQWLDAAIKHTDSVEDCAPMSREQLTLMLFNQGLAFSDNDIWLPANLATTISSVLS